MTFAYRRSNTTNPVFDSTSPFADPFVDIASVVMPTSVPAMLRHAEFFAVTNETLRAAYTRIAAYFITDLVIEGELGEDEKEAQKEYMLDEAGIIEFLLDAGLSSLVYGNAWISVMSPIIRYLACPKCRTQYRFGEIHSQKRYCYSWKGAFHAKCPACNFSGDFGEPIDVPDESAPVILKLWNPHDIRINYVESTGQCANYDWVIPADFRTEVRLGTNTAVLEHTPWPWIKAALNNQNVRMTPEYVYHWKEPSLPGLRFRGVGVPRSIINYRQLYHIQVLRRMNEVLAMGHVVPLRVISPANTAGKDMAGDILQGGYLGDVKSRIMQIVANHKADPSAYHFAPIPLQFQALGADARQLVPADILNQSLEVLLNGSDVPIDFFKMSMQTTNAPVGLRLIDRMWSPYVGGLNRALRFIGRRVQFLKSWEKAKYSLRSVQLVDSIEANQLKVQMAQAGLASRTEALRAVDLDFKKETKQKLEDQWIENKEQAAFQQKVDSFAFSRDMANAQPGGGQPGGAPAQPGAQPAPQDPSAQGGGGAPPAGPGQAPGVPPGSDPLAGIIPQPGQPMDPTELESRAQAAASALLQMPEGQRFGKLQELKQANSNFYSIVKQKLQEMRSEARSKGQQLIMQQSGFQ